MSELTDEELDAMQARCDAAMHQPSVDGSYDMLTLPALDATRSAVADVPRLLAEVRQLRDEVMRLSARDETDAINEGCDVAADNLREIALYGRTVGVFGGEKMEATAQAILALRTSAHDWAIAAEAEARGRKVAEMDCDLLRARDISDVDRVTILQFVEMYGEHMESSSGEPRYIDRKQAANDARAVLARIRQLLRLPEVPEGKSP